MQCGVIRPACFDLPQILFPKNPTPVSYGLARRRPLERSANFSGRLVAVLVQFLESLLQRPELHGAFRRPFPINIESVGRRWTGRRSLQGREQSLHRCVVTVGGGHFCTPYKLESVQSRSGGIAVWSRAVVVNLRRTVCCLDARPGSIWWQKMDAGREYAGFLVVLRTSISTIKMQSTANLGRAFLCCLVIVRYVRTAFRDLSAAALRELRRGHGQDRKAAPDRIAPTRLRLQVRRLQPDHVGRAGAAGRSSPSPPRVGAPAAALVGIDRI